MAASLLHAGEIHRGQVIGVQDGDTITVRTEAFEQVRVRLYGIDCPEKAQPHGPEAGEHLYGIVYGKDVELEVIDIDRYSRYVALVRLGGELVNERMVRDGYAWTYERYCRLEGACADFRAAEKAAREARAGLWADGAPVAPWEHRSHKRHRRGHDGS
jgi:endonuclease YncB( thermonuclease family)